MSLMLISNPVASLTLNFYRKSPDVAFFIVLIIQDLPTNMSAYENSNMDIL